jgi:hypothetical protein
MGSGQSFAFGQKIVERQKLKEKVNILLQIPF